MVCIDVVFTLSISQKIKEKISQRIFSISLHQNFSHGEINDFCIFLDLNRHTSQHNGLTVMLNTLTVLSTNSNDVMYGHQDIQLSIGRIARIKTYISNFNWLLALIPKTIISSFRFKMISSTDHDSKVIQNYIFVFHKKKHSEIWMNWPLANYFRTSPLIYQYLVP